MSCNSCSSVTLPVGATGPSGLNGAAGAAGAAGLFGGFSLEFEFDSGTASTPPTGEIRFNNATPASVTEIYISTTGTGAVDSTAFLDSFNDNGDANNYGLIRIFKEDNSTVFWMGKVKNVQTSGASRTITVQYISSGGTFADTNHTIVSFVSNGVNGNNRSGVLDNYVILDDGNDYTSQVPVKVREFSIPASTFANNQDEVHIDYGFSGDMIDANLDLDTESFVNGYIYLQVRLVQGATTRYAQFMETIETPTLPVTNLSTFINPGTTTRLKFYRTGTDKLRPVLLSSHGETVGAGLADSAGNNGNIQTSDPSAGNVEDYLFQEFGTVFRGMFMLNNASLAEIDGFDFSQAITTEVYMWRGDLQVVVPGQPEILEPGRRNAIQSADYNPAFRLMNLHATHNKKVILT